MKDQFDLLWVYLVTVSAALFCQVHGTVSRAEYLGGGAPVGRGDGHTNADADLRTYLGVHERQFEGLDDMAGHMLAFLGVAYALHQCDKLVTAESCNDIDTAQACTDAGRGHHQKVVSEIVPMFVVDLFESVQVHIEQCKCVVLSELLFDHLGDCGAIEHSGEAVMQCHVAQVADVVAQLAGDCAARAVHQQANGDADEQADQNGDDAVA